MTTKEILKYIKREEKYIKKMEDEIYECKCGISASQRALDNWKKQLKIAEKRESKAKKGL